MSKIAARYFDGVTAVSHDVQVTVAAGVVEIAAEDGTRLARWPLAEVAAVGDPGEHGAAMVTCTGWPQARLVLDSPDARTIFAGLKPNLRRLDGGRRTGFAYWTVLAAASAAVIALIVLAVDRLPAWVAPVVPFSWEQWLGERVMGGLAADEGHCSAAAGAAALDGLVRRLTAAADIDHPVAVRVIGWPMVNAFAAPGGQIGLLAGLIESAESADEVAGVLAHELGHVVHHHPTEGVIRQLGLAAILQLLIGGSGIEDAAGFGQMLLTLSYSREAEAEADATALAILDRAGLRSDGLHQFFARLQKESGGAEFLPALLSTHPATSERLASTQRPTAGAPALTPDEWQALRGICGAK